MIILGCITFLFALWYCLGLIQVYEKENGVVVLFGNPRRTVTSGLCHIWWPLERMVRFTTTIIEIECREATVITKAGEHDDGKKYGAVALRVSPSFYFRWPEGDDLLQTIKVVDNPRDLQSLKNLFEETVLDSVRTAGGNNIWKKITSDRKGFAKSAEKNLTDEENDPIKLARLRDLRIVLTHVALPDELRSAITKPEIASLERAAAEEDAEAAAYTRKRLFEAIGEDIEKEKLLTLREMAKGTANTMFVIPAEIVSMFEKAKGAGINMASVLKGLGFSDEQIKNILGAFSAKGVM